MMPVPAEFDPWPVLRWGFFWLLLGALLLGSAQQGWCEKTPLQVHFYPGLGRQVSNSGDWELEVEGVVFKKKKRPWMLSLLSLGVRNQQFSDEEKTMFDERVRGFLVDNLRRVEVRIDLGGKEYSLGKSGPNGRFSGSLHLSAAELAQLPLTNGWVHFTRLSPKTGESSGRILLVPHDGVTLISDIDDTIKISEVRDHPALLRNTFALPFRAVPGMAERYQQWRRDGVTNVFYVSGSPWQLQGALASFFKEAGFPEGVFFQRPFRIKDRTLLSLFASPEKFKVGAIVPILERLPGQTFVLVGDSGEKDPEIYGALARNYPQRIGHIYIREVTQEGAKRYEQAFEGVPRDKWTLFRESQELPERLELK